jgi:6-phosphogluconolactonase
MSKTALYSAVDDELTHYEVDADQATLIKRDTIKVPSFVQYAWPHPSRRLLYVTTSNRGPGLKADFNHVTAYRIDQHTGALSQLGDPAPLTRRAVHCCVADGGTILLNAHNLPRSGITVHRLNGDGSIGAEITQSRDLQTGIYPHQVMAAGKMVVLVDRGNDAAHGKPEDPGALRIFDLNHGNLSDVAAIAPNGGYGFGPRHIDFHPTRPWLYASLERQNRLHMFRITGNALEAAPAYTCDSLTDRANQKPHQLAGTIHVHPNGRWVYLANRADHKIDVDGKKVFGGGENTIAVYAIDQHSGAPTPIQFADTHCYHVRTFAFDPGQRLLVAASIKPMDVHTASGIEHIPAALSVFRVGDDGKLEFVRRYGVETNGRTHYWMGIVQVG